MPRRRVVGWLVALAALSAAAPADAYVIESFGMASATNGIVLGPDGNFWVSETYNSPGTVARVSPAGVVIQRIPVGTRAAVAGGRAERARVGRRHRRRQARLDRRDVAHAERARRLHGRGLGLRPRRHRRRRQREHVLHDARRRGSGQSVHRPVDGRPPRREPRRHHDHRRRGHRVRPRGLRRAPVGAGCLRRRRLQALPLAISPRTDQFDIAGAPDGIAADSSGNLWVALYDGGGVARISGSSVATFSQPAARPSVRDRRRRGRLHLRPRKRQQQHPAHDDVGAVHELPRRRHAPAVADRQRARRRHLVHRLPEREPAALRQRAAAREHDRRHRRSARRRAPSPPRSTRAATTRRSSSTTGRPPPTAAPPRR